MCLGIGYATSKYPDREFVYRGVIISNGDMGYQGRKPSQRLNTIGNNHGSIESINGQWYIFYHRHTHNTSFSRQACAEKIKILPNGTISQVEMTSCGLNGGPLLAEGSYPAAIACNLHRGRMGHIVNGISKADRPFITHGGEERFITGIRDGTVIGYKYFQFSGKRCQRRYEIVRKRRRNFVIFRRGGVTKIRCCLAQKECLRFAVSGA